MSKSSWVFAVVLIAACGIVGWAWPGSAEVEPAGVLLARPAPGAVASVQPPASNVLAPRSPDAAAETMPNARFRLLQVFAPAAGPGAEAVIAVDGLPAKTYRVGDTVVGALVLQSVRQNQATLGPADGPAAAVLAIDPPVPPAAESMRQPPTAGVVDAPVIGPDRAPAVDRSPVPVTDPDHGEDTSNH